MVATALAGIVLLAVLATNLALVRSGVRITQYSEMESQVRSGLDQLGSHLRIASGIRWNGPRDITLTLPTAGGASTQVTYAWASADGTLFLVPGASSTATAGRVTLIRGLVDPATGAPGITFTRFDRNGGPATTDLATKRIQVSLLLGRKARTMAASKETVSATFTMRNKPTE